MAKTEKQRPVVLVTGCGEGGIGFAYCQAFYSYGCQVFATDVQALESMAKLRDLGMDTGFLDVTSEESVRDTVARVVKQAGRIDILVNNAGISVGGQSAEVSLKDIRRNFDVNVFGVMGLIQEVLPHMVQQGGFLLMQCPRKSLPNLWWIK